MGKIACKTNIKSDSVDERRGLRMLLIESSNEVEKQFRTAFGFGPPASSIIAVATLEEALALKDRVEFDIVVLGVSLGAEGLLENVKSFMKACPSLPLIVLAEVEDEKMAQASIDVGAQDYLTKPIAFDCSIRQRMLNAIARHATSESDRKTIQELQSSSQIDTLTGLFNRAAFNRESERQVAIANRNGMPLSIGMIDVDFFKTINDKYGHMVGDQVLKGLSALVATTSRVSDIPCRYGGEEFCVILPDTDEEQAFGWANRVCKIVRETKIETRQAPLAITVSIGTATFVRGSTSIDEALERADAGCIEAKSRGRDQVVVASTDHMLSLTKSENHNPLLKNVKAADVMSTIIMMAAETMTIGQAAGMMLECQCEVVPVVAASGELSGLLTNEEIVSHALRGGRWEDTIDSIAGQTVTFTEETPFQQIWSLFQRFPIRRAVVTRDGKPFGIINRGQLLRRLAAQFELGEKTFEPTNENSTGSRQIFQEVKRTAENFLQSKSLPAEEAGQDFSLLIAATQLQELASQLLQLSSPSQGNISGIATCSAAALTNL